MILLPWRRLHGDFRKALRLECYSDFFFPPGALVLEVETNFPRRDIGLNAQLLYPRQSRECGTHPVRSAGGSEHARHEQRHVGRNRRSYRRVGRGTCNHASQREECQDRLPESTHRILHVCVTVVVRVARLHDLRTGRSVGNSPTLRQGGTTIFPVNFRFCFSIMSNISFGVILLASYSTRRQSLSESTSTAPTPGSPNRASWTLLGQVSQTRWSRSLMPSTCSLTSRGSFRGVP